MDIISTTREINLRTKTEKEIFTENFYLNFHNITFAFRYNRRFFSPNFIKITLKTGFVCNSVSLKVFRLESVCVCPQFIFLRTEVFKSVRTL